MPNIIRILVIFVIPIAYKSDNTLHAAILPYIYGSSTNG